MFAALLLISFAHAVPKPDRAAATRKFVASCLKAFQDQGGEIGHDICGCVAHESSHQKVPVAVLLREAAQIEADAKHPIGDSRLLATFQVCAVESMKSALGGN